LLPGQLVVNVLGPTGLAVAGVTVAFVVTSGSATLSASSAVTAANGQAAVGLTLGANTGAVAVTATVTGLTPVTFNLTAVLNTLPQISAGGVVGAGLSVPAVTALSANAIVSIFGQNFAPAGSPLAMVGSGDLVGGKLPTLFAGVCVEINAVRAPLFAVTPGQINLQVPALPQSGKVTVQVIANCGQPTESRSAATTVAVQAATPEFFFFTHNPNGQNAVAAINPVTAANVGAPNLIPGATSIPARPGDFVSIFVTGLGATNPSYGPGVLAPDAAKVTAPVSVSLGGVQLPPGNIPYVGVAPGNAGLYQLNIQIPAGAPNGNLPLAVTVGGFSTPAGGYVTIQSDVNCAGYGYSALATVHHEYVAANADNYTVTIAGTWPTLAKVDSGGHVTSADGYDICFADAANTAKLKWEMESYNGGTGAIVAHVLAGAISSTADTTFSIYYGNASISGFQGGVVGSAWDSTTYPYQAVWHLGNGTTLNGNDSSLNGNNLTNHGAAATSGEIDGAAAFSSAYMTAIPSKSLDFSGTASFSFWENPASLGNPVLTSRTACNAGNWQIYDGVRSGLYFNFWTGNTAVPAYTNIQLSTGVWSHVVVTYDGSAARFYINGSLTNTVSISGTRNSNSNTFNVGTDSCSGYLHGSLDEVRIAQGAWPPTLIKTMYNNQSAPGTFVTVSQMTPVASLSAPAGAQ
jgi:uncharacterized protein (TIGR03437 family)